MTHDALFLVGVLCCLTGTWLLGPGWGLLGTGSALITASIVVARYRRKK